MSKKELTVKSMISFNGPDGDYVDFDTISEEQKAMFREEVGKRLSEVASQIFTRKIAEGYTFKN